MPKLDDTKSEDAASAAVTEAKDSESDLTVDYDGETYTVPRVWSIDVHEYFGDGNYANGLREMMGRPQWLRFKAKHQDMSAIGEFIDAVGKAGGTGNR